MTMNHLFGLFSKESDSIPLVAVKVEGDILGRGARVRLSQRFKNNEKKALEAIYRFPLPESGAVCGFQAIIDGKEIHGIVEERNKAFEIYDKKLSEGHGGYLLDQERPNIFTLSVGNLNPGSEVLVRIDYIILLDAEGNRVRFFLPTTISPRYIPLHMPEEEGIPESDKVHPEYADAVLYGLSMALDIRRPELLESIESPSHPVRIQAEGDVTRISLSAESVKMDRDFILYMGYKEAFSSRAYRQRTERGTFIQLDLFLDDSADPAGTSSDDQAVEPKGKMPSKEFIFVLDCSGSMTGDSIQEAKRALEICLKGLEGGTAFNIIRFGSTFESLFKEPQQYSAASLKRALDYLERVDADLGGTEILAPLQHIYSTSPAQAHYQRELVVLTDGQVGKEQEIIDLVAENQGSTRVFPLGIGAGPNEYFIKGMARAARGSCEFIFPGERIEPKVLRLFEKIMKNGIERPSIHWGDSVEQAPASPTVFLQSPVTIFARYEDGGPADGKILVKGRLQGRERTWEVEVIDSDEGDSSIPALWARETIRDLEDALGGLFQTGSRQIQRKSKKWRELILDLSKSYGILSGLTSFVAIEERKEEDKTTGQVVIRKVPVPVTVGWHGIGGLLVEKMRPQSRPLGIFFQTMDTSHALYPDETSVNYQIKLKPIRRKTGDSDELEVMLSILSLQDPAGGLKLNGDVARRLGIRLKEIGELAKEIELDGDADRFLLLSTAVLLQVLEQFFPAHKSSWHAVVKKSRDWLREVIKGGNPMIQGEELGSWVERYVRENVKVSWRG